MPRWHIVGHSRVCGFGSVHAPPLIEASTPPLPDIARRRRHKRRRPGETWGGSLTDASPPSRLTWRHLTRLRHCIAGPSSARADPRPRQARVDDPDDDRGVGLDAVSESRREPHVLGCRDVAKYGSRAVGRDSAGTLPQPHVGPPVPPAGCLPARSCPRASAIAGRHAVILSQPEAPWTSRRGMAAIQLRQNGSVDDCRCARLRTNAPPEAQVVVPPDGSATSPRLVTAARPVAGATRHPAMCRRVRRFVREPAARDDRVGCHRDQRRGASWQAFYQLYLYIVRA